MGTFSSLHDWESVFDIEDAKQNNSVYILVVDGCETEQFKSSSAVSEQKQKTKPRPGGQVPSYTQGET